MKKKFLFDAGLLFALGCGLASAGEGRIPIWQPITIGPGDEGSYVLTRDITAAAGSPAIDVLPGTASVEIDLNGFTVQGALNVDVIHASQIDSLTVRNGTIEGGLNGVRVDEARKVVIEDVKAQFNRANGFYLWPVAQAAVRRNLVVGSTQTGIYIAGNVDFLVQASVQDNLVQETEVNGIAVYGYGSHLIVGNTVRSVGNDGILLFGGRDGVIRENAVTESGRRGIYLLAQGTLIFDNVSGNNTESGIVVSGNGRNHLERNVTDFNGEAGLWISSPGNTYGRNVARGNMVIPSSGCPATPAACAAPDVCIDDFTSTSFGDNMGPGPGC